MINKEAWAGIAICLSASRSLLRVTEHWTLSIVKHNNNFGIRYHPEISNTSTSGHEFVPEQA